MKRFIFVVAVFVFVFGCNTETKKVGSVRNTGNTGNTRNVDFRFKRIAEFVIDGKEYEKQIAHSTQSIKKYRRYADKAVFYLGRGANKQLLAFKNKDA